MIEAYNSYVQKAQLVEQCSLRASCQATYLDTVACRLQVTASLSMDSTRGLRAAENFAKTLTQQCAAATWNPCGKRWCVPDLPSVDVPASTVQSLSVQAISL